MTKHRYISTPQKPELEITNSPIPESYETPIPGEVEEKLSENRGTSYDTPSDSPLTAPIHMPSREDLTLNMLPANLIYKYDEYRSDESRMSAFFFTFLGAFLGVIINWVTSHPLVISIPSLIIEFIILIVLIFSGGFTYSFHKRAKETKSEIDRLGRK
jgi:hypothetical protein